MQTSIPRSDKERLGLHLDEVEALLETRGELGILSISVLQREGRRVEDGWEDYDVTLRSISLFLNEYLNRHMRRTDMLLDPVVAGNTFVLFLSPPREDRSLDLIDLTRVRHRLSRSLNQYLSRTLPHAAIERFGVYVGGALIRHDTAIETRRIIHRSMDSAFADALSQKKAEVRRHAVQLNHILQSGRLQTVYQPVVDVQRQVVLGFEALTRVQATEFPTPDLLFRAAHENGALWKLERLSRRRALEGLPRVDPAQLLFINIEPDSIHDPELGGAAFLADLRRAGLRPQQLVLEMTEHVAVKDFAAFREALDRFRALGFRLAMDDVGSGYAGLQAIAEIRPDFLKVDMALVRELHLHPIKRELITTIRRFSDRTGITMVAEGVENTDELAALAQAGVRCAQGYLFAKPAPQPEEPDWSEFVAILCDPTQV